MFFSPSIISNLLLRILLTLLVDELKLTNNDTVSETTYHTKFVFPINSFESSDDYVFLKSVIMDFFTWYLRQQFHWLRVSIAYRLYWPVLVNIDIMDSSIEYIARKYSWCHFYMFIVYNSPFLHVYCLQFAILHKHKPMKKKRKKWILVYSYDFDGLLFPSNDQCTIHCS